MVLPTLSVGLPPSVKYPWKHPHRGTQECALGHSKPAALTVTNNHHNTPMCHRSWGLEPHHPLAGPESLKGLGRLGKFRAGTSTSAL